MNMGYLSIHLVLLKYFSLELWFWSYKFLWSLFVKLVSKYLYFEGANVNGIVLLILNSACFFTIGKQLTFVYLLYILQL